MTAVPVDQLTWGSKLQAAQPQPCHCFPDPISQNDTQPLAAASCTTFQCCCRAAAVRGPADGGSIVANAASVTSAQSKCALGDKPPGHPKIFFNNVHQNVAGSPPPLPHRPASITIKNSSDTPLSPHSLMQPVPVLSPCWHALCCSCAVDCIALDQLALHGGLTRGLEHIDGTHRVAHTTSLHASG